MRREAAAVQDDAALCEAASLFGPPSLYLPLSLSIYFYSLRPNGKKCRSALSAPQSRFGRRTAQNLSGFLSPERDLWERTLPLEGGHSPVTTRASPTFMYSTAARKGFSSPHYHSRQANPITTKNPATDGNTRNAQDIIH